MRLRTICFVFAASPMLLAASGCSGGVADTGGTTTGGGAGTTTGTGTGTTTGTGTGGMFDAGGVITTYTTGEGPIALMPGQEETNCVVVSLGNAEGGFVRRVRANLGTGSHHMIVYTTTDPLSSTPTACQALGGILSGDHPIFIAQQPMAQLDFPSDENNIPVGYQIDPNQTIKVELHTINTTQAPLMVTGTFYIDTVPLSTNITVSNIAFWGDETINIPANGTFDTGVMFQAALPGTHSFAVTTHQHHLGTGMKVWYSTGNTDTADMVADGLDWSNPPLVMLTPALDFAAGATKGFAYECAWNNPTASPVTFGESYYNEMCFLWHYYYPSQGFQLCVNTPKPGGGNSSFCK